MQLAQKLNKYKQFKGQSISLGDLPQVVIIFVVIAIVLGMGALVLTGMQNQTNATINPTTYNVFTKGLEGMTTFSNWQPTLAIAVIAAVILVIIVGLFARRQKGGI